MVNYGAFSLWRADASALVGLLDRPTLTVRDDFDTIGLRQGSINTRLGVPDVAANLRQTPSDAAQFWLVHFIGPIKREWLTELKGAGIELVIYLPQNTYVVWGDAAALFRLDKLAASRPSIQWTGPYHPAYRLEASLQQAALSLQADKMLDVTVQFYVNANLNQSLDRLRALGGAVHHQPSSVLHFTNVSLQLPAGQLLSVAQWPDVFNIEPWAAPHMLDEVQGQIVAGNVISISGAIVPSGTGYLNWLASKGFPTTQTSYPIVDVVDDGLDQGNANTILHPDFHELGNPASPDRIDSIANCTAEASGDGKAGHGNLNAGIVGAYNNGTGFPYQDAAGYRIGLGISPYSRIASTKIFTSSGGYDISACNDTDTGVVSQSYAQGALITSNSWGDASARGVYDTPAQTYDALTRDASATTPGNQPILHIFAAGNSGSSAGTINSPGTAKNVVTVGATEGVRDQGVSDGCLITSANNADDVISFSSRGPTSDGRLKPDLMAPG
ncbi:MAG: S8 family serine peptidase, partial [Chloroflexi bacterium]|nr:S8 family serine peptidase [Chloroflexota bacterium]